MSELLPYTSKPSSHGATPALLLVGLGILIIMSLDSLYGGPTSAPIIGICVLFILALKYPPTAVGLCLFPLIVFVAYRLWFSGGVNTNSTIDLGRFWIRTLTFFGAGLLAIATSGYRVRLDGVRMQLVKILEAVPLPLLVSDASGTILAVSLSTLDASGLSKENLLGFKLPDVVGTHLLEEAEENWYQHWISSPENRIFEVDLQFGKLRSRARVGRIGSGRHAIMIVIFI